MFKRSPLVEYYRKGIFLNYRREYEEYYNPHTKSMNACEDIFFLSIQLEPKWFGYDDFYYDGHTMKRVTILGVALTKGFSYQWEDLG
jgi:hypothetical protein